MVVHFVCSGNTFRSRLAEAYLKSLDIPSVEVISSGARALVDAQHQIMPYTVLLLKQHGLTGFASDHKTLLTQDRLDKSDIVICVNRAVYRECQEAGLTLPERTFVWDISDYVPILAEDQAMLARHELPKVCESTFYKIQEHINELVALLKKPKSHEQVDILDENGQPTGSTTDIATMHAKGLIHGGMHVGLYTLGGGIVLERRSSNIIFNPGLWDLSMGGVMASTETPEQTLLREVYEELGIKLNPEHLQKLFVLEYSHYLPHYGFHNHNFTHTYIARIPEHVQFSLQASEVAEARIFGIDEVEAMNKNNKRAVGTIIPTHAYNQRIIDGIKAALA